MPLLTLIVPQTLTFLSSIQVIHFTPHITCYIITTFFLYCACYTVNSNNYDRRLQLFTWTSGDVTVTVRTLETSERVSEYNSQNIVLLKIIPTQSHDCKWRKTERVSEWVVSSLKSYGSKNRGSGPVCLFVTWHPSILHQAGDNLEAISEPDQV